MTLEQRPILLKLLNGSVDDRVATGNNAAWLCPCGYQRHIVGRSGLVAGPTKGYIVECPQCNNHYFVAPEGKDNGCTLEVRQVSRN